MQEFETYTLPNGIKGIHRRTRSSVTHCALVINAGTRDEHKDEYGLAHFAEHAIFKGTKRHKAYQITCRLENRGGELNAYTTKEDTTIHATTLRSDFSKAVELIADVAFNSTFPERELAKEREVIVDEINTYKDSPADMIFDTFEDSIFAGSELGHNILGTPDSVRGLTSAKCRCFIDKFYTPRNMAIYCVDPSPFDKVEREITRHFGDLEFPDFDNVRDLPVATERFETVIDNNGHQAHTLMGARLFGKYDDRRHALFLLNNIIGGPCMNSRLNQELREKRGLVYTVDSTISLMSNCGTFQIYCGCDPSSLKQCKSIIRRELDKLANSTMKPSVLERARRQYMGQLHISSEHRESRAIALGKSLLYYNEIHDIEFITQRMMEVTAQQILDIAELIHPDNCSSLTIM